MAKPLYQQGTNRIEVVIRKEETTAQQDGETADKITADNQQGQQDGQGGVSGGASATARFMRVNLSKAVGLAKELANIGSQYYQHIQGLRNGDEALADNIDRNFEIVQDVGGTASHIAMGALFGSSGGVGGAVIGASVAAISSGVSLASKYANRQLDFDYKRFREDNGTAYQRARASINLTTGRLR